MFFTLLVWLSISNGERGLEEMLGWSLVCFGICILQTEHMKHTRRRNWSICRDINSIIQEHEKKTVCHDLMAPDIGMISISYLQFCKVSMEQVASVINIILKPLLSSPNKPVGCWEQILLHGIC
jgi:hypothetical protein